MCKISGESVNPPSIGFKSSRQRCYHRYQVLEGKLDVIYLLQNNTGFLCKCRLVYLFQVLSHICVCVRPAIGICEILTSEECEQLISLAVHTHSYLAESCGAWVSHAVTCLLLDLLEGKYIENTSDCRKIINQKR